MPEYKPVEKGIVVRAVVNPKPISKFPNDSRRDMHLRYTVSQMMREGYDEMEFVDFHTVIKYELVPEEGFDNLYDAYLAWWNREYLPSHGVETSNLTFKILHVETEPDIVIIPAVLSAYTLKNFQGPLNTTHRVDGLGWAVSYEVREAAIFEPAYSTLEDAYRAYKQKMESLWTSPSITDIYNLAPNFEKETPMQFTISKNQIKRQINALEDLRQDQIKEIQKDLETKLAKLEKGEPISCSVCGTTALEKITSQLEYLYSLELADSITCTESEKENIFRTFEISKSVESAE